MVVLSATLVGFLGAAAPAALGMCLLSFKLVKKKKKKKGAFPFQRFQLGIPGLSVLGVTRVMGHADSVAVAEGVVCAPDLLGYVPTSGARNGVVHYHQPEGKSWFHYLEKKKAVLHRQTKKPRKEASTSMNFNNVHEFL